MAWNRLIKRPFVSDRTVPVSDPDPFLCVCWQTSEISRLTAAPDFLFGPAQLKMDQREHLNRMLRFWAQLECATAFSP